MASFQFTSLPSTGYSTPAGWWSYCMSIMYYVWEVLCPKTKYQYQARILVSSSVHYSTSGNNTTYYELLVRQRIYSRAWSFMGAPFRIAFRNSQYRSACRYYREMAMTTVRAAPEEARWMIWERKLNIVLGGTLGTRTGAYTFVCDDC